MFGQVCPLDRTPVVCHKRRLERAHPTERERELTELPRTWQETQLTARDSEQRTLPDLGGRSKGPPRAKSASSPPHCWSPSQGRKWRRQPSSRGHHSPRSLSLLLLLPETQRWPRKSRPCRGPTKENRLNHGSPRLERLNFPSLRQSKQAKACPPPHRAAAAGSPSRWPPRPGHNSVHHRPATTPSPSNNALVLEGRPLSESAPPWPAIKSKEAAIGN